MKRLLTSRDFTPMPWANGKGVTVELARSDAAGAMRWRLSRASVVEEGPFSIFPGVERVLTVLTGPGFDLEGPGIALQARPMVPLAFPGNLALRATRVTDPCDDFNVMTARHLTQPEVRVLRGPETLEPARLWAVYWPEADRLLLTDEGFFFAGDGPAIAVVLPGQEEF